MNQPSIQHPIQTAGKWSDVPTRLATISIGVPILWMIWCHTMTRILFFHGTHVFVLYEWTIIAFRHSKQNDPNGVTMSPLSFMSIVPIILSVLLVSIDKDDMFLAAMVLVIGCTVIALQQSATALIHSMVLITIPFRIWIQVVRTPHYGFLQTVTLLLTVWNCDTGALLAGRAFGRTNQPPPPQSIRPTNSNNSNRIRSWLSHISPNKSMEGLLGGIILGVLTYTGMPWFWRCIQYWNILLPSDTVLQDCRSYGMQDILVGIILSICALIGDLWESTLKRHYSCKDSGKLLPGHGGILDRFDSSLLAIVIYHVVYIQHLQPLRGF